MASSKHGGPRPPSLFSYRLLLLLSLIPISSATVLLPEPTQEAPEDEPPKMEVPVFVFEGHRVSNVYYFDDETSIDDHAQVRRKRAVLDNSVLPKDDSIDGPFSYKKLGIDLLLVVDNTVYEHFYASVKGDEYAAVHGIHDYYSSVLFEVRRCLMTSAMMLLIAAFLTLAGSHLLVETAGQNEIQDLSCWNLHR